jgi:hypothetical protein
MDTSMENNVLASSSKLEARDISALVSGTNRELSDIRESLVKGNQSLQGLVVLEDGGSVHGCEISSEELLLQGEGVGGHMGSLCFMFKTSAIGCVKNRDLSDLLLHKQKRLK